MSSRRIRLNGFKTSAPSHTTAGMWRHPANESHRYRELGFWIETARVLEDAGFDALFIADAVGVLDVYEDSPRQTIREALQLPTDDPLLAISAMAAVTTRLGFGVTLSTTYEQPYLLARKMATLDHLTDGRVGWNVVTSALESAARNIGSGTQLGHDERYAMADEFMDVAYQLWEASWDDDAVVRDRDGGVYTDPDRVRAIEHHGRYFDVPGIGLTEPSIQRTPVIYQAGSSPAGIEFAAKHAEGVFLSAPRPDIARRTTDRLRARAAELGRDPQDIKVFAIMTIVTGAHDGEATAKYEDYRQYASIEGNLARLSGITQVDMSRYDLDEPLAYVDAPGIQSILANFTLADPTREWTPRQIAEHMAVSSFGPIVVGGPATVADELERWAEEADVDGFNVADVMPPATFADMAAHVVPELRRRGVLLPPDGTALREHFYGDGVTRVLETHPAARHRRRRRVEPRTESTHD
jgi:FMN-dependent oxidoreductase (nitrilotriacetate monooxygenase family)